MKNEITLHAKYIYGEPHLGPACEKSYALFQLMKRGFLKTNELPFLATMGFTIKIIGEDKKRFAREMKKDEIEVEMTHES